MRGGGEARRDERGHRDDREQDDPDARLEERERPAAGLVVDLAADDRVAGDIGHARARAEHDHQDGDHDQVRDQADECQRDRRERDRQAEQAPPGEAAQDAQAKEHAGGQADEDRGEDHAPARLAAVQRMGDVDLPEADDHARGRERAYHPDHDPADHPGLADEPPPFHDGLGHRRRRDLAAGPAARNLPERVNRQGGHHERRRVEVQRQVDLVRGEVVRDGAERPADQGEQAKDQPGDRRGAVGGEQAELVSLLELVRWHQVRDRSVLGRRPEQRGAGRQELHGVRPGQLVHQVELEVQRDGQVQQGPHHVADDHGHATVEAVGDGPGQRAEDQRGQQRDQPDAADRRALRHRRTLRRPPVPGQIVRQCGDREQAQPVPQAGKGQRDPQPPEGPDGEHAGPAVAQRGCKVHGVRVSADRSPVPAPARIHSAATGNTASVPPISRLLGA